MAQKSAVLQLLALALISSIFLSQNIGAEHLHFAS
jgi:hypothetical protein